MLHKTGFALLLGLLVSSSVVGQEWANKMFKVRNHDFGSVARNAKAEYEFVFSNIYLEDIHIASVHSSCGCTTPTIKKAWLKTYEKGAILAHFNTDKFLGRKGATLTVTIDKPFPAQVQLHVGGFIRGDVLVTPGSVQLGSVDQGAATVQKVTVSHSGWGNWKILGVKSANPHLSAEVVERARNSQQVSYDLVVHLDGEAPAGYLNDHLMLVTSEGSASQIPVLVEGRVEPAITISPASLFMGVVQSGKKVTKQLVVRGKKPFRILSITCEDKSFEFATPANDTPRTVHLVPVTFVAGEGKGKVIKTIRIQTDLGEMVPELAAYAVVTTP